MSRKVVRYSALGGVAVAAVVATAYFLFLRGTQAGEGADAGKDESPAVSAKSGASKGIDPLFSQPPQNWSRDQREPVVDPFRPRSDVVQTAYGDIEPRRLATDPDARPLYAASEGGYRGLDGNSASLRLAGAAESKTTDSPPPPANETADPFGLRKVGQDNAPANARTKTPASTAAASQSSSQKQKPVMQPVAAPPHAGSAPGGSNLRSIEPAQLDRATLDAAAGAADGAEASDSPSLFDRPVRDAKATSRDVDAKNSRRGSAFDRTGAKASKTSSGTDSLQPGSQYGALNSESDRQPASDDDGVGPIGPLNRAGVQGSNVQGGLAGRDFSSGEAASSVLRSRPPATPSARAGGMTGSGRPGSRQIEGKQSPQITVEKIAPDELQIGKPAKIELHVRNTGAVTAQSVEVRDMVPDGTQFIAANPPASPGLQGELVWSLGALKPGDNTTIEIELAPTTEGEVGSVAVVSFQAEAGAHSRVTKPDLTLQVTAAKRVMIGQEVQLNIKVGNPGTGPATGVVLEEHVPGGLKHAAGSELEFEVGTLKPGETRDLELAVTAAQAGRLVNLITARSDGNLQVQAQCELEVIAPGLAISMDGPARRYLERQATYTVSVSNPGTAPAKDVELVTRLPKGLKFVKANNSGHYDPQTHSVAWSLEELPPAETGTVELTALPIEPGEQRVRAEGRAKQNLADEKEQITLVEGLAALLFEVVDVADPIEVKGETEYEIRITNQGSKSADNVRLVAFLPPELKFMNAEGPTRFAVQGQRVIFEPLGRLSPKADTTYRIAVQGLQPGDLRMKVELTADDMRQPVIKEESTRVYSDE